MTLVTLEKLEGWRVAWPQCQRALWQGKQQCPYGVTVVTPVPVHSARVGIARWDAQYPQAHPVQATVLLLWE